MAPFPTCVVVLRLYFVSCYTRACYRPLATFIPSSFDGDVSLVPLLFIFLYLSDLSSNLSVYPEAEGCLGLRRRRYLL